MENKIERLKREISKRGNLIKFESVIEKLINEIIDSGCKISCCDICDTSKIEQSIDGTIKNHIRISFKDKKEKPIHLIWDILHEFGHHLSGKPNGKEKSYSRESLAWDYGFDTLIKISELKDYQDDFENYKEKCLLTYKMQE